MQRVSTFSSFAHGAAAAAGMMLATCVSPLAAQGGAAAGSVRPRDTIVVRTLNATRIPVDSIRALMRALDRLEYGTENWLYISKQIDSLVGPGMPQLVVRAMRFNAAPKGWIGLSPQGPQHQYMDSAGQRVTYFAYPLIVSVDPESPAGRAGIAAGDRLIAYDGTDVINHEFNLTRMLVPDRKLAVTVRRDGERKDFSLIVAKTPERVAFRRFEPAELMPALPKMRGEGTSILRGGVVVRSPMLPGNIYIISRDGVLGATMSPVSPELAKALRLSTGVLVNEVPESSPAWTAGLRAGDVVTGVGSQPVTTMQDLQALVQARMFAREVPLTIVRDHKTREISVKW